MIYHLNYLCLYWLRKLNRKTAPLVLWQRWLFPSFNISTIVQLFCLPKDEFYKGSDWTLSSITIYTKPWLKSMWWNLKLSSALQKNSPMQMKDHLIKCLQWWGSEWIQASITMFTKPWLKSMWQNLKLSSALQKNSPMQMMEHLIPYPINKIGQWW